MDIIIERFPKMVREKLKEHVKKIFLFGSRARGDFNIDSDYDFAVIVDERNEIIEDMVIDVSSELLSEYNTLIGPIVWNEEEWESRKKYPIGINIMKDGIEI